MAVITGGQIDPYVQKSMQQGRGLAENRLVTAMQEAGATSRAAAAERGASARAGAQIGSQEKMQAAQLEAQDRRAAEAEKAKREDRTFRSMERESSERFQAKQNKLMLDWDKKRFGMSQEERKALRAEINANTTLDRIIRAEQHANTLNVQMSIAQGFINKETAEQKAETWAAEEYAKDDETIKVRDSMLEAVSTSAARDTRMDLPIKGELGLPGVRGTVERRLGWLAGASTLMGTPGVVAAGAKRGWEIPEYLRAREKDIKPGTQAEPMAVLQDQINTHVKAPVSIEDLSPSSIAEFEKKVASGDIHGVNIRETRNVLDGFLPILEAKYKEADESDKPLWNEEIETVETFIHSINMLAHKTDVPIKGSNTDTVGSVVRFALGPIDGTSHGRILRGIREQTGGSFAGVIDNLSGALKNPAQLPILETYSPEETKLIMEENELRRQNYPSLFEDQTTITNNWGAD